MNNIESELHNINAEIRQYEHECNWEKLGPCLAEDLIFRRIDKSIAIKDDVREGLKDRKYFHLSNSDMDIQFNANRLDHAVVTLTVDYHFKKLDKERKGLARNIRFFRREDGKWKLYAWFNEEVQKTEQGYVLGA